jgi:hypothetical protein
MADNLGTFTDDFLEILEASASRSPNGLPRPEYGLLYLLYGINQY